MADQVNCGGAGGQHADGQRQRGPPGTAMRRESPSAPERRRGVLCPVWAGLEVVGF